MTNIKTSLIAAAVSVAILAAPIVANAATPSAPQNRSMEGGSMEGMMGMMNACTRMMNKMADNMGYGAMGARHGSMMGKAASKMS